MEGAAVTRCRPPSRRPTSVIVRAVSTRRISRRLRPSPTVTVFPRLRCAHAAVREGARPTEIPREEPDVPSDAQPGKYKIIGATAALPSRHPRRLPVAPPRSGRGARAWHARRPSWGERRAAGKKLMPHMAGGARSGSARLDHLPAAGPPHSPGGIAIGRRVRRWHCHSERMVPSGSRWLGPSSPLRRQRRSGERLRRPGRSHGSPADGGLPVWSVGGLPVRPTSARSSGIVSRGQRKMGG